MKKTLLAIAVALAGCSSAPTIAELETDAHAAAVLVVGAATAVEAHPEALAEAKVLGAQLAKKAGVSPELQEQINQAVLMEDVDTLKALALQVAHETTPAPATK